MRSVRLGAFVFALAFVIALSLGAAPATQRPTRPGAIRPAPAKAAEMAAAPAPEPKTSSPKTALRLPKTEWVSAASFASRMGLKFSWTQENRRFLLKTLKGDMEFELDSRECTLLGLRTFLGEAARIVKGQPSFSRIDEQKLLLPLVRAGAWQASIPQLRKILIDPGHGGNDSGKINEKLKLEEKILVLDTAQRLKKLLEKEGYRVLLTRTDDRSIELADRAEMARRAGADLLVSLHFNSVEEGAERVTGVEVFTMTPQNQLSTDQKPDPQYVPIANPGNANDHWNAVLGFALHGSLLKELKASDRGLKRGRLAVLRLATCPAALVEGGYLSNDSDSKKLATPQYRQRVAEAVANGIKDYAIALEAAKRSRR